MRSFLTQFGWLWLAGILLGLGWRAFRFFRMYRDPKAEYLYVEIPLTTVLVYAALAALAVSTVILLIRRKPLEV